MTKPLEAPFYFSGVIDHDGECQQVSDGEAQFWTVYERGSDGLSSAICDCYHRDDAVAATERFNALIAALEQSQRANAAQDDHINQQADRIEQLEKGHQEAAKHITSWRRLAKQNIAEREKDIAELDAARKRVAELDASQPAVKPFSWISVELELPDPKSKKRVCAYTPSEHQDLMYRSLPASLFKAVCSDATHWCYFTEPGTTQMQYSQLAVKLPHRKDERFWPGDASEFDVLGYVIAVEKAIRAAGGTVQGDE